MMAIQRFIYKLIISLALTREFKHDQSNIAWWTGKWYNMGWHSMSQPGREFLCKITELGYFAADFVLGHIILFFMLPVLAIPYVDKFHSVILFWLRPSRQIRPPIYSLKQSKLRKRRVIRFAILYFVMLFIFVILLVAPLIAKRMGKDQTINEALWKTIGVSKDVSDQMMFLLQPLDHGLNDTVSYYTGSQLGAAFQASSSSGGNPTTSGDWGKYKMI